MKLAISTKNGNEVCPRVESEVVPRIGEYVYIDGSTYEVLKITHVVGLHNEVRLVECKVKADAKGKRG
jgi:hypothetical protein